MLPELQKKHVCGTGAKDVVEDDEVVDDQPFLDLTYLSVAVEETLEVVEPLEVIVKFGEVSTLGVVVPLGCKEEEIFLGQVGFITSQWV